MKDYLNKNGFDVFFDSDKLRAGDDWEHKLEVAIVGHQKFIFFITPHSARRPDGYCLNEIALALVHKKNIISVMIDFEIPPLSIVRTQYLDFQELSKNDKLNNETNDELFETKMQYLVDVLKGEKEIDTDGVQAKVFSDLKPIDFTQDFAKHKKLIGREWVKEKITTWIDENPESKVLLITAEAGYGKSAIAAHLANTLKNVIGIHFCSYNFDNKKDPLNVIKTLAFQFQSQIPEYLKYIQQVQIDNKNTYELFEELILNPLSYLKTDKTYIFIIDALDEAANDDGNNELANLIRDEFNKLPSNIKIIITTRPKHKLSFPNPTILDAKDEENITDCKAFIKQGLIDNGYLKKFSDDMFVSTLMDKSDANMLYLSQFFEGIKNRTVDIAHPEKFPKGLNGIYECFFERITKDEDEYDDKYAPIFEVILAYDQPIPKLLLIDILGIRLKAFKRITTKLGSMLKENDGIIELYHKSLSDWLPSDDNESFFIDIEEGREMMASFMKKLSPDIYKKEYLSFFDFNKMLVNNTYLTDKELISYFKLFENQESQKEIIELLMELGRHFSLHEKMYKTIAIRKRTLKITEVLYRGNSDRWAEDYTLSLMNLAASYGKINKIDKAIQFVEKALSILEPLFKNNPEKWAAKYSLSQNLIANFYRSVNNLKEAVMSDAGAEKIMRQLYKNDPDRWAGSFVRSLNNLALSLTKWDDHNDPAIQYSNQAQRIIEPLYMESPIKWAGFYIKSLNILSNLWFQFPNINKAIKYGELALIVSEQQYKLNSERWIEDYAMNLNTLGFLYESIGKVNEAIQLLGKGVKLLEPLYWENPYRWAEGFGKSLDNLASSHIRVNDVNKAIQLGVRSLDVFEPLFNENPNRWAKDFAISLNNLAISFYKNSDVSQSILLLEKGTQEFRELYKKDKKWFNNLIKFLGVLKYMYNETGKSKKAAELEREIQQIKEYE